MQDFFALFGLDLCLSIEGCICNLAVLGILAFVLC